MIHSKGRSRTGVVAPFLLLDIQHLPGTWARCADTAGSSATTNVDTMPAFAGQFTSITIGADGLGLAGSYDNTSRHFKIVHCGSQSCVHYRHRL
jgi:hypothetical protein